MTCRSMCLLSPQGGYAPWATSRKRGKTEPDSHNYEPDESEVWRMHQAQRHFRDRGRWALFFSSLLYRFSLFLCCFVSCSCFSCSYWFSLVLVYTSVVLLIVFLCSCSFAWVAIWPLYVWPLYVWPLYVLLRVRFLYFLFDCCIAVWLLPCLLYVCCMMLYDAELNHMKHLLEQPKTKPNKTKQKHVG